MFGFLQRHLIGLGLLLTAAIAPLPAQAVDEPENIFKHRKAVMKALAGHAGAIAGVAKGEVSFVSDVSAHAHGINEMSKGIVKLFPEGTGLAQLPDTRALDKIWSDRAKFEAAAKNLEMQSAHLVEIAKGGDVPAIASQFQAVGKACGGCHKPFRAEKK